MYSRKYWVGIRVSDKALFKPGWQTTASGEREVQKLLRQVLLKYLLPKDQQLFERAYGYMK